MAWNSKPVAKKVWGARPAARGQAVQATSLIPPNADMTPLAAESFEWYIPIVYHPGGNKPLPMKGYALNNTISRIVNFAGQERYIVSIEKIEREPGWESS